MKRYTEPFWAYLSQVHIARKLVWGAIALTVIDMVYANLMGIHMANRDTQCILGAALPRWAFLAYEHFVELSIIVLLGVFAGTVIEQYIKRLRRFFPKNQVLAFLYGSLLPVCSCGVVPVIEHMKQRVPLRVIITFVIATPLLNPYIIALSISVMGLKYALLRVGASFVLSVGVGLAVHWAGVRLFPAELGRYSSCGTGCDVPSPDPFVRTIQIVRGLLPYILMAGAASYTLEMFNPKQYMSWFNFSNPWTAMLVMLLIGIPVYVCNGADVFFLKPLMQFTDLTMGPALVFSLTASAVCLSSIVMLTRFLGRKLTVTLVVSVAVIALGIGAAIQLWG